MIREIYYSEKEWGSNALETDAIEDDLIEIQIYDTKKSELEGKSVYIDKISAIKLAKRLRKLAYSNRGYNE